MDGMVRSVWVDRDTRLAVHRGPPAARQVAARLRRSINCCFWKRGSVSRATATLAAPFFAQVEASGLNTNREPQWLETQVIGQKTFAQSDTLVLDLDDLLAIRANNVESGRRLFTVKLVIAMLPVQLHLTNEMTVEHHWQRPIDGCQRNQSIDFADFGQKIFSVKRFGKGNRRPHDDFPRLGNPKTATSEIIQSFLEQRVWMVLKFFPDRDDSRGKMRLSR